MLSASPGRAREKERERPATLISLSVPTARVFSQLIGEEAAGGIFFFSVVWEGLLFGTQKGAKRVTLDAMSRRKLGSRPQHLSAIQGKPRGRATMCGHVESGGDVSQDELKENSGHTLVFFLLCFIVSTARMGWMCAGTGYTDYKPGDG